MFDLDFTFLFTAVNLVILYLILRKFLFKRVSDFMENRETAIAKAIEEGAARKAEGEAYKEEYQEKFARAGKEISALMENAAAKANAEYDSILAKAKRDAELIREKARIDTERERAAMLTEVRNSVLSISLAAASKVLAKNVDTEENRKLVEEFLNDEGAA